MSTTKIKAQGKVIDLNQSNYKGAGGEGTIYVKSGYAYKIYHDPAKMIPVAKIQELARLDRPNILCPLFPITDVKDNPIGFGMRYVDKTEYLCKLFTRGFRDTNGISPATINSLVKQMQDTLKHIHEHKTLVVDYNELNFLVSNDFTDVFHIDVDCYQTPNYPATAIMESIRDPKVVSNKFSELSDWFSAGIIFFQLYMGTHPYKGRNDSYGRNDWQKMMKDGVSVFNKATRLPPNVQDWSVVPKGHLRWFERVFEHGERCAPPEPDQVAATAGQIVPQIVSSNDKFTLKLVRKYDGKIERIRWINGAAYAYTDKSIYVDNRLLTSHAQEAGFTAKRSKHDFVYVQNDAPVVITFNEITERLSWRTLDSKYTGEFDASSYFIANQKLYVVNNGKLVEYSFMNLGAKVLASQQIVGNVFHTHTTVEGMVIQDILGTTRLLIPTQAGVAHLVNAPDLNRARIIAGKYERGTAIIIAEQNGKLTRWALSFNKQVNDFVARKEEGVAMQDVQLAVLDKGVSVATNEDRLEVFLDPQKIKLVDDSPFVNNQKLHAFGNDIYLVNGAELHQVSMK